MTPATVGSSTQKENILTTSTTVIDELIDKHIAISTDLANLKTERTAINDHLIAAGIEADENIRADLEAEVDEARQAARSLALALKEAEAAKTALDKRIDSGDDSVTPLKAVEADMAMRATRGKQKPAEAALRKAERALAPFLADNHLALLAADAIKDLVDVPVLVRKRPADVQGMPDALVVSQTEPTLGHGTVSTSGHIQVTAIGSTNLDDSALEAALRATGSEVTVAGGLVDFSIARWSVMPLASPSEDAVRRFANALDREFNKALKWSRAAGGFTYYETRWETVEASLSVVGTGHARGTVRALLGVEDERPPLEQIDHYLHKALANLNVGVHTSAGLLQTANVTDLRDLGLWITEDEELISGRAYTQKFGCTVELDFIYEPVGV